ncbi:MAG: single-stranded DNA-binding protein [Bacteroidaceae bacterium]|nr:single-stranded DNA-binding protein [Bacteroidaceae bacterium]
MVQVEIIGNLGSDAQVVQYNGSKFASFRVAENRKVGDHEETTWYEITLNNPSEKLMQYLKCGQCVFVRGVPRYRIFDSAKYHCKMVGVTIMSNELQLVGAQPKTEEKPVENKDELADVKAF